MTLKLETLRNTEYKRDFLKEAVFQSNAFDGGLHLYWPTIIIWFSHFLTIGKYANRQFMFDWCEAKGK